MITIRFDGLSPTVIYATPQPIDRVVTSLVPGRQALTEVFAVAI